MTTNLTTPPTLSTARPNLWTAYRSEFFKWRKHRFYTALVIMPPALVLFLIAMLALAQGGRGANGIPNLSFPAPYDVGQKGAFTFAADILLIQVASLIPLLIILACTWHVVNEYSWRTIKMIATRQPIRTEIVLSKCLFALTAVAGIYVSFIVAWLLLSIGFKLIYNDPLRIADYDVEAITKSLQYFALWCLGNFVWGLWAIAASFRFKSIVSGIVTYILYSNVDNILSQLGARFINKPSLMEGMPSWIKGIIDFAKFVHPVLFSSNLNRIAQTPNDGVVSSLPLWWSWLIIAGYIVLFVSISILVFKERDIVE